MTEYVTTDRGDRVAYDRYGSGPALVFVAGAGPHRASDPVTTATAQAVAATGATTIVFDRLGRGESVADGVLDLDRELTAIRALLDVAGGSAVLCGHSSGCSIALRAAADGLPVTGLALWEAPIAGDPAEATAWVAEFLRRLDAGELESALEQYMKDMPPEWLERALSSPQTVTQTVSLRADAESLAWAEMIESAELIASAVPGARALRVPGAFHSWEPGPMAAVLSELLATTAARSAH
ncbi:alpha/beta hydrolase [Georgenia sp. H159]|uniref:alpha/beta fold hydrolase n=1 Tax=Georgenia sp. H159 TaxID=3076115 RepID=UPI002D76A48C|nr:alpha/beta hydrolase [Georgenia sp. H159]